MPSKNRPNICITWHAAFDHPSRTDIFCSVIKQIVLERLNILHI